MCRRPRDRFLRPPMRGAHNLFRGIPQNDLAAKEGNIFPESGLPALTHNPAAAFALRIATTIFIRLHPQVQFGIVCWNRNPVIFSSFRRRILASNFKLLMGLFSC